jgi:hypothetical protein
MMDITYVTVAVRGFVKGDDNRAEKTFGPAKGTDIVCKASLVLDPPYEVEYESMDGETKTRRIHRVGLAGYGNYKRRGGGIRS